MQNSKVFGRLRAIQGLCIVFCGSSDFVADGEWLTMVMIATTGMAARAPMVLVVTRKEEEEEDEG